MILISPTDSAGITAPAGELHRVLRVSALVWLLTTLGIALGALAPGLAPGGYPHPALHGALAEALGILATNLRLLAAPFLLVMFGLHRSRSARTFGTLLVAGLIAFNTLRVGLAIGHFGLRLAPYVPQLPLEWLALALAASAWLAACHRPAAKPRVLRGYAAAVLAAAIAAACCETLLIPHAARARSALRAGGEPSGADSAPRPCSSRPAADCLHPNPAPAGALAARSQAPFPSPYGLGSARPPWPALSGSVNHHDPQGGTR